MLVLQKGIDMPWMIASLADEIEEKANTRVQVLLEQRVLT